MQRQVAGDDDAPVDYFVPSFLFTYQRLYDILRTFCRFRAALMLALFPFLSSLNDRTRTFPLFPLISTGTGGLTLLLPPVHPHPPG